MSRLLDKRERAIEEAIVAQFNQTPEQLGAWVLIGLEYVLGHEYDREIVRALRALDPAVAPLWVWRLWRVPGHDDPIRDGRHLIARLVTEPKVKGAISKGAIRGVTMPNLLPAELAGLTSEGPYLEAELLEGDSPDDGLSPGPYRPMTWELVRRLEACAHALRNATIDELDAKRIHHADSAWKREERRKRQWFADLVRSEKEKRKAQRGELVRVPGDGNVSMSSTLVALRKIAAEGVSA